MGKMPGEEEFGGLFDPTEEILGESLVWPPADSYTIWQGVVYPGPGSRWLRHFPPPSPFSKPDLFYSFARLGAYGKPSESRIKEWISQNGLLTRKDENLSGAAVLEDGTVNQQPISVENFKSEVARARALLELYAEIRATNIHALDTRVAQPRSVVDQELASYFSGSDDQRLTVLMETLSSLALYPVLAIADKVLSDLVSQLVAPVCPRTIRGFDIPATAKRDELSSYAAATIRNYRLRQGWYCPDLLSAMYLQFYLLVTRNQPMRSCENPACRMPFPATRTNRRFCCDTCRSNARRYR